MCTLSPEIIHLRIVQDTPQDFDAGLQLTRQGLRQDLGAASARQLHWPM